MPFIKDDLFAELKSIFFKIFAAATNEDKKQTTQLSIGNIVYYFDPPNIDNLIAKEEKKEKKQSVSAFLEFTEQEILKMPKQFRKEFRVDGCTARVTERKSGKSGHCYEIRYRRNGYDVSASSVNLQEAKDKFIIALQEAVSITGTKSKVPSDFYEFSEYYFKNYRLGKVAEKTYRDGISLFEAHVKPFIKNMKIKNITPEHCKKALDRVVELGQGRTLEDMRSILNQIFGMAIAHGLMSRNPLAVLVYDSHERESGTPISKDNEKKFLENLIGTEFLLPFAIFFYTGLRANEIYTAVLDGEFIIANNSKRKRNQKKETKKIAVSPMLKPYLSKPFNSKDFPDYHTMLSKLKETLPLHTLKDCRMTFSTRCQECGVDKTVVKLFMGHSLRDVLGKHYTDFSDEYYIKEAQKIKY